MLYACALNLTKERFWHEKFEILDYSSWNISVHIFCRFFCLQQFSSVWLVSHCVRNIFINPFLTSQNSFPFQWRLYCHLCLLPKLLTIIFWKFLCSTNWPVTYEENILLPWTSEIFFQERANSGIFQGSLKIFPWRSQKVLKFNFTHSKLRKQPFLFKHSKISKCRRGQSPLSDVYAHYTHLQHFLLWAHTFPRPNHLLPLGETSASPHHVHSIIHVPNNVIFLQQVT